MNEKRQDNNYDLIRLLAACSVIISHSYIIIGLQEEDFLSKHTRSNICFSDLGVWTFFIISGFLITQSLDRSKNFLDFIWKRFIRIYPALIVVVLLSMFVLGPAITDYSLPDYFECPQLYRYGISASLIQMHFALPGVFTHQPLRFVNGSLWTLPYEFLLYLSVAIQIFLIDTASKRFFVPLLLTTALLLYFINCRAIALPFCGISLHWLAMFSIFFLLGASVYRYNLLPFILKVNFFVILFFNVIALFWLPKELFGFVCLPIFIFRFAFFYPDKINFVSKFGDFSYGIYIYSFVVQQLLQYFFKPSLFAMMFFSTAISILMGIASWFLIEKPALKLKNIFTYAKLPVYIRAKTD